MDDNFGIAARIKAFDTRQGGNPTRLGDYYFYPNGAWRELEPLGALTEPPKDEYQRLINIVSYHQGRLNESVRAFRDLKEQASHSHPNQAAVRELRHLQKVVKERSAALEAAKAELATTDQAKAIEGHKQFQAEERQRLSAWKDELHKIQI